MKEFTKSFSLILIISSLPVLAALPASAGSPEKEQPTRTVRVTTGIESVQGWEHGLIQGNPNLARWHWDPIYSYKQGYIKLPVPTAKPDVARNAYSKDKQTVHYNKPAPAFQYPVVQGPDSRPTHIPYSDKALEEVRANLLAPEMPIAPVNESRHEENVSGRISQPSKENKVHEPVVSTYGELYSRKDNLDTSLKYNSQRTSVYGQLINAQEKNRYNGAKPIKRKGN